MAWTTLCDLADLTPGRGHYVEIDAFRLAVFLLDDAGTDAATDDVGTDAATDDVADAATDRAAVAGAATSARVAASSAPPAPAGAAASARLAASSAPPAPVGPAASAGVAVMDNACPHAGASMAGGWIEAGCAVCPQHAWAFDLITGQLKHVGGAAIAVYRARLRDYQGRTLVQADLPGV